MVSSGLNGAFRFDGERGTSRRLGGWEIVIVAVDAPCAGSGMVWVAAAVGGVVCCDASWDDAGGWLEEGGKRCCVWKGCEMST